MKICGTEIIFYGKQCFCTSIVLYVLSALATVSSAVCLGMYLAADSVFSWQDVHDIVDTDGPLPIGGMLVALGGFLVAGLTTCLQSCGATEKYLSRILFTPLIFGLMLSILAVVLDVFFLVDVATSTLRYEFNTGDTDRHYNDRGWSSDRDYYRTTTTYHTDNNILDYFQAIICVNAVSLIMVINHLILFSIGICKTKSVLRKADDGNEDDVPLLDEENSMSADLIDVSLINRMELVSFVVIGSVFGILGTTFSAVFMYDSDIFCVGFVWFLPMWPFAIFLCNSKTCLSSKVWYRTTYVLGIFCSLFSVVGFIYEITAVSMQDYEDLLPSILLIYFEVMTIISLLACFVLSVKVCVKLQNPIWQPLFDQRLEETEQPSQSFGPELNILSESPPSYADSAGQTQLPCQNESSTSFENHPETINEDADEHQATSVYTGAPFLDD